MKESAKEKEWSKMDPKYMEMIVPSHEIPVQPVNYGSTGTTGPLPPNYCFTFCNRAMQDQYHPDCSHSYSLINTTGPPTVQLIPTSMDTSRNHYLSS